ncbi:ribonuclease domain-containing protein [uncultured Psychrosphaera sp.]|jgi:hypothetical protein|uniref:ribonuclease domain-containing protein n=1 Tax=uncultured Psychrosphaera sp. TaxID=1403522 RepID=UPI002611FA0A|nr:ribonuclease domain-containing protein [uncultured Psychrosphaera sp.]
MNLKLTMKVIIFLIGTLLLTFNTIAKEPEDCVKRGPTKSNDEYENYRMARYVIMENKVRLNVFNNNENKLPKLSRNESYYEFDLGQDGFSGRGRHRVVILTQDNPKKILASYFTQDHYRNFCKIR